MNTTQTLIAEIKARRGLTSDTSLAEALQWTPQRVSNYVRGVSHADDATALQLAAAARKDFPTVLAQIQADRAKNDTIRSAWLIVAERLAA